jgi:hypothetical protein
MKRESCIGEWYKVYFPRYISSTHEAAHGLTCPYFGAWHISLLAFPLSTPPLDALIAHIISLPSLTTP